MKLKSKGPKDHGDEPSSSATYWKKTGYILETIPV